MVRSYWPEDREESLPRKECCYICGEGGPEALGGGGGGLGEWWGRGGVPGRRLRTGLLSSQSCRVANTLPQRTKPGAQIPGCVDTARKVSGDQERAPWFVGMLQIALFLPE